MLLDGYGLKWKTPQIYSKLCFSQVLRTNGCTIENINLDDHVIYVPVPIVWFANPSLLHVDLKSFLQKACRHGREFHTVPKLENPMIMVVQSQPSWGLWMFEVLWHISGMAFNGFLVVSAGAQPSKFKISSIGKTVDLLIAKFRKESVSLHGPPFCSVCTDDRSNTMALALFWQINHGGVPMPSSMTGC